MIAARPTETDVLNFALNLLAIVYANNTTGTAKGGFYPGGMNGNIITV